MFAELSQRVKNKLHGRGPEFTASSEEGTAGKEANASVPKEKSNPFRMVLLAHKHDAASAFAQLPRDLINCLLLYAEKRAPLVWVLTEHEKTKLTIADEGRTATNDGQGYRMQPFYSLEPLSVENCTYANFIYVVNPGVQPSTTLEIGLCPADKLMGYFNDNSDKSDCHVRQDESCVLYSWNGGNGEVFGNKRRAELFGGCRPGDLMRLRVDMRKSRVKFYNYGAYTAPPRAPEGSPVPSPSFLSNPFSSTTPPELPAACLTMSHTDFMAANVPQLVAKFFYVPAQAVPFCWFLGSGYKGSVTLYESVLSYF